MAPDTRLAQLRDDLPTYDEYTSRFEPDEGNPGYSYTLYTPAASDIRWLLDIAAAALTEHTPECPHTRHGQDCGMCQLLYAP